MDLDGLHMRERMPFAKDAATEGPRQNALPYAPPFYLPYIVPFLTIVTQYSGASWHTLIAPFFVWVLIPLADYFAGKTTSSFSSRLSAAQRKQLESMLSFKLAVILWCPIQIGVLLWAAQRVQHMGTAVNDLRLFGLVWSCSLIAAEGINCSHELFHRRSAVERAFGKILLISVLYGHFHIEHTRGHHFRVATQEDPATLRRGESFYTFFPRTVVGGYLSAWRLEERRLKRQGRACYSFHNEMIRVALLQSCFCLSIYACLGVRALSLVLFQAGCAILLLEQINAIEHYGLIRRKLPSDASRRYQALEVTEGSPQLPAGYLSLVPLLLIPPAWRYVMDRVLLSYLSKWDKDDRRTKAAIAPALGR